MQVDPRLPLDVSRETFDRLKAFEALVLEWTKKINLVSPNTVADLWERHIVDSVQVSCHVDGFEHWLDIGAGGGFPGVVLAIIFAERRPEATITLVESDKRKSVFLSTASRKLGLRTKVVPKRVQELPAANADVVSARALANLDQLLDFAELHMAPNGVAVFQKGASWQEEVQSASQKWSFACDVVNSVTDPDAAILKIKNLKRT